MDRTLYPHILERHGGDGADGAAQSDLASLHCHYGPRRGELTLHCEPLRAVYSKQCVEALAQAFASYEVGKAAHSWFEEWKERKEEELAEVVAARQRGYELGVSIDVAAPVVLLPMDAIEPKAPVLRVVLGKLSVCSAGVAASDRETPLRTPVQGGTPSPLHAGGAASAYAPRNAR